MSTTDAKELLDYMRVHNPEKEQWNVYQIGCVSTPLNFASQQLRAFKLTSALHENNRIEGKRVAIIGAGLAGLSAGIDCLLKGAQSLALFERTHELMSFQRGTVHRYIHPMIFRWPHIDANQDKTDFDILNWKAGNADEIRRHILEQIDILLNDCYKQRYKEAKRQAEEKNIKLNFPNFYFHCLGSDVRHVKLMAEDKIEIFAEAQQAIRLKDRRKYLAPLGKDGGDEFLPVGPAVNYKKEYDLVIVAVGFGLEKELSGVPFRSYWNLDTLAQATIRGTWPKRWLVSGTGDGGLIDAIRLVLFDVDQQNLTAVLLGKIDEVNVEDSDKQWMLELFNYKWQSELRNFRIELQRKENDLVQRYPTRELMAQNQVLIGKEIQDNFDKLTGKYKHFYKSLKKFIKRYRRTDTVVYLNGTGQLPYELGASVFNRFIIYLLRNECGLRYCSGYMSVISQPDQKRSYFVAFKQKSQDGISTAETVKEMEVDEIVIRQGAESALGELFGQSVVQEAIIKSSKITVSNVDTDLWKNNIFQEY